MLLRTNSISSLADRNRGTPDTDMSKHDLFYLFDSLWSETLVFTTKPSSLPVPTTTLIAELGEVPEKSKLSDLPATLHVRSMSETEVTAASPISSISVLSSTQKPQSVVSRRDSGDFFGAEDSSFADVRQEIEGSPWKKSEAGRRTRKKKKKKKGIVRTSSRSLSELEFEELKGFMDLGYVFLERDRDSALVSIIPGLQWLGIEGKGCGSERDGEGGILRPYLSEAWGVSGAKPAMKWRIPEMGNDERAMKDQLRFWAHAVASTVR